MEPSADGLTLTVRMEGELDLFCAAEFAREVVARIRPPLTLVILDAGELRYLDSSGTGAIIRILQHSKVAGSRVWIAGLQPAPRKVLRMINLFAILREFAHVDEAHAMALAQRNV